MIRLKKNKIKLNEIVYWYNWNNWGKKENIINYGYVINLKNNNSIIEKIENNNKKIFNINNELLYKINNN